MVNEEKQQELKTYYALKLLSSGSNKIALLKEIRSIKNCDLQTGKDIIDTPNSIIAYVEDEAIAEKLKLTLQKTGALIEIFQIQSEKILSTISEDLNINVDNVEQKEISNFDIKSIFNEKIQDVLLTKQTILLLVMVGIAIYLHSVSKSHIIDFVLLFALFVYRYFTCLKPGQKDNIIKFFFNLFLFILAWSLVGLDYPSSIQLGMTTYFGGFAPIFDGYLFIQRLSKQDNQEVSKENNITFAHVILFLLFVNVFVQMSCPEDYTPEAETQRVAQEKALTLEKERQAREDALKTINGIAFRVLSKQYTSEAGLQLFGIVSTGNSLVLQVNVQIRNEGKSPYKLSKIGAVLLDNNGATYDGATLTNALDMLNASQDILNPGMTTTKMLFFKIPEEKDYTLKLYDGGFFSDPVIIKL